MHTHTRKKEDLSADRASSFVRKRKHEKKRVVYYKEQKSKRAKREKERERERDGWMMLKQSIGQKKYIQLFVSNVSLPQSSYVCVNVENF